MKLIVHNLELKKMKSLDYFEMADALCVRGYGGLWQTFLQTFTSMQFCAIWTKTIKWTMCADDCLQNASANGNMLFRLNKIDCNILKWELLASTIKLRFENFLEKNKILCLLAFKN